VIATKEAPSLSRAPRSSEFPWQWLPVGVFVFFATLNMLDRQLLAALAPTIKREFHLSNAQYGGLISVFYAAQLITCPLAGLFIDRVGVTLGPSVSIFFWSIAGVATGWTRTLRALVACRFGLGIGEAGGTTAPGAVLAGFLNSAELGVGGSAVQIGGSLGSMAAPLLVAALAPRYGWRFIFQACGILGLLWVPVWLLTTKRIPARFKANRKQPTPFGTLLKDRRFWGVVVAYALAKQTLWVSWTTIYFVQDRHLTMIEANRRFVWAVSVFAILGAVTAGILATRWVRQGSAGLAARRKVWWYMAPLTLLTAAVPFMPTASLAAAAIGVSYFAVAGLWISTQLMSIDLYGVGRAAFAYSILECAQKLLDMLTSPVIGEAVDHFGFKAACLIMSVIPILGLAVLEFCLRGNRDTPMRLVQFQA
jgi:ACS family hexuronate transporter-like MFS transporter